jgi:hypothetical protein
MNDMTEKRTKDIYAMNEDDEERWPTKVEHVHEERTKCHSAVYKIHSCICECFWISEVSSFVHGTVVTIYGLR